MSQPVRQHGCILAGLITAIVLCGIPVWAQDSVPRVADSSTVPAPASPRFYVLDSWDEVTDSTQTTIGDPAGSAIAHLCRFYGRQFDPLSLSRASRSPLAWPRILVGELPDPRRQRIEIRALLERNGLSYREVIPLDIRPGALADTIAASLLQDDPVLFNSPDAAIVYGFDYREPDHWWWLDRAGSPEIVLESERIAQFTYWSDEPTAGVMWPVSGTAEAAVQPEDSLDWIFLRTVVQSVQGIPAEGVEPYPLSLRRFRDLLASSDTLPPLSANSGDPDPLGILQAKSAREHLIDVLQRSRGQRLDIPSTEALRLSEYHLTSAVSALSDIAAALYGHSEGTPSMDTLAVKWNGIRPRRVALEAMSELIKSERLALESLQQVVAAEEKAQPVKPAKSSRRRGH